MRTHIKPRQVDAFRAAVATGSATAAAEALFITQPAVSRLLGDLEKAVGFPLFERQGRGLRPTTDGRRLYDTVERVYLGLDAVADTARSIREGDAGSLRVGALPVYAGGRIAERAGGFVAEHPEIRLEFDSADRDDLIEGLLARRFDVAVSTIPADHAGIDEIALGEREAVCILPPDHPLAAHKRIRLGAIVDVPFIALSGANPFKSVIDQAVDRANGSVRIVAAARTQRAVSLMVGAGAGISIVDPDICRVLPPGMVAERPLEPAIRWRFGILYNQRTGHSVAARRFIDYLVNSED